MSPGEVATRGVIISYDLRRGQLLFLQVWTQFTFNGQQVHDACRAYLQSNRLPLPLSRYVTSAGFRGISDTDLSYRMAGSFVLHLTERFGLPTVLRFFQVNNRDESVDATRARMQAVFGVPLEEAERSWLEMLRR